MGVEVRLLYGVLYIGRRERFLLWEKTVDKDWVKDYNKGINLVKNLHLEKIQLNKVII